jgi:16S rRNA (guanine527-N7)-methyltransferase
VGSSSTSAEGLRELIAGESAIVIDPVGTERLGQFLALLERWNKRINLTSSTTWRDLKPLFAEAVWAAGIYPEEPRRHLDLGSGAGFPAIPLKILRPAIVLDLVESRVKRSVFLETVVRDLHLANVRVHNLRAEELLSAERAERYDCVSWKGLKLDPEVIRLLWLRTSERCQFWAFHGENSPVFVGSEAEGRLVLMRRERFPQKDRWYLSVYEKR